MASGAVESNRHSAGGGRHSGAVVVPGNAAVKVGGPSRSGGLQIFDLRFFDFFKNEATDLYENKGSARKKTRNEATVEGSGQSAVGSCAPVEIAGQWHHEIGIGQPRVRDRPSTSDLRLFSKTKPPSCMKTKDRLLRKSGTKPPGRAVSSPRKAVGGDARRSRPSPAPPVKLGDH